MMQLPSLWMVMEEGFGLCFSPTVVCPSWQREITGRLSGRNAHPLAPPGIRRSREETSEPASAELLVRHTRVARSAQGCVEAAAAQIESQDGKELPNGTSADAVGTSTALHYAPAGRVSNRRPSHYESARSPSTAARLRY
jgi:hypothetical protein